MSQHWNLSFPAYLIWDGWGHIRVAQKLASRGLEFGTTQQLQIATGRHKSAIHATHFGYLATAEVLFRSEKACLIDFGVIAIRTADVLPNRAAVGDYVTGEIGLSIDRTTVVPEEIESSVPQYRWEVEKITADVTPYIPHPANSRVLVKDESRLRYREVQATSDVCGLPTTESVRGGFILHCKQIDF
jgi:hypothetical protein